MFSRSSWVVAAIGGLSLVSAPAAAQVFNGGIPAGYTCNGVCGTTGADGDVTLAPAGGTRVGYVTTFGSDEEPNPLGIAGTTNGSQLTSGTFSVTNGQTLSFAFNYITSDGTLNFTDYAYARLLGVGGASDITLFTARTTPGGNTVPGFGLPAVAAGVTLNPATVLITPGETEFSALGDDSGDCWRGPGQGCGNTGWVFISYMAGVSGEYQLQLGVSNVGDTQYASALAFDYSLGAGGVPQQPGTTPPTVTPEPATMALTAGGLLLLAGVARRRRES